MPVGICKLCLQTRDLQDSHMMPKALYKKSRWGGQGNPNPTLVTTKAIVQTSKQIKDHVFCRDCEQLLNNNGERYVMTLVAEKGKFPLLAGLQTIRPSSVTPVFTHYDLTDLPEIDRGQLAYYALSIFWRASIHIWDKADRTKTAIDLGGYNEVLRKYLLGQSEFPIDVLLMLVVCTDPLSQNSFYMPNKGHADKETYTFLTRGLNFFMVLGDQVTDAMRGVCIIRGTRKLIQIRSCEEKVIEAARHLASGHKRPTGKRK